MVPFWLMRRSSVRGECNCVIEHIQVDVILTGGGVCVPATDVSTGARVVFDSHFRLPVITNDTAVASDSELVLYHAAPQTRRAAPKREAQPLKRARHTGDAALAADTHQADAALAAVTDLTIGSSSTEPETAQDSQPQS